MRHATLGVCVCVRANESQKKQENMVTKEGFSTIVSDKRRKAPTNSNRERLGGCSLQLFFFEY